MTEVMMALGQFRFSLSTAAYQNLRRSVAYRWPKQERIGRAPARQFVGKGDEIITLEGIIYPEFKGGLKQIDKMREVAGTGQPKMMTDGTGKVWGKWCIESIDEKQGTFFANGIPRKQEFALRLGFYGEDS
ncbi:phage tail protein [Desulfuromonas acetoxidans]|uniref:phage tail protein n=1 Tax=Desulfuromonas acetoxidans TaxID=891 RepID=UPI00292F9B3A|nr:phage tail protein [Desulfuromonas acetoxidans]